MFRKIVSNLSFSPALVGQLGFYAKRLRKEQATRRLGLIFVALALSVQALVVFQPSESVNAASSNDLVYGGLGLGANRSINKFLAPYDANTNNLKDITSYIGITREEIVAAQYGSFITGSVKQSWGHVQKYSTAQGELTIPILDSAGKQLTTAYTRPLSLSNGTNAKIYGWIGHSAKIGWFAIMQSCGNIVTEKTPPPLTPANIVQSKTALNLSQGSINATTITAKEGDNIQYTVTVKNTGGTAAEVTLSENLEDVLEYATLSVAGGGTLNTSTKVLTWPTITLAAGAQQSRTFNVRVLDTIPVTGTGQSEPTSYDCRMNNVFGNAVIINVTCPTPKTVEYVVTELPKTGPTENLIFAGVVLAVVAYFYARTRQVGKEVRLIRRDLNTGTI